MNCQQAQEMLSQSETPGVSSDLAGHLAGCSDCRQFAEKLARLEQKWRAMHLPPDADRGRHAFLNSLPQAGMPARDNSHLGSGRWLPSRWAVAASILLLIGLSAWFFFFPTHAQASDVVERLVDWNLDLTQAPLEERGSLFSHSAGSLKRDVLQSKLSPEDRELAEQLLAIGTWLVENDDPLAQADRFNDLADHLLDRLDKASAKTDAKEAKRMAKHFRRVAQVGVGGNLERAEASGAQRDDKAHTRLERIRQRDARRAEKLAALLAIAPDASQREIRQALNAAKHSKKDRKSGAEQKNGSAAEKND
jgi:hypothetical protein